MSDGRATPRRAKGSAGAQGSSATTLERDGLRDLAVRVEARLERFFDAEVSRWVRLQPELRELIDVLATLTLSGGKRLRPAFCYWAFVGSGGDPVDPQIIDAGAGLELLHTALLIHDDLIDDASLRRGIETSHVRFAARHREHGWAGASDRFGSNVAVLLGDLAIFYAYGLLSGAPPPARHLFQQLGVEVGLGQYLELVTTAEDRRDYAAARLIARYKSGKYTIERPLQLGAALAGQLDQLEPLSAYGLPLGEAFQLCDDLLGVFGDSAVTGKPVGSDLRQGKCTVLMATAQRRATGARAIQLLARVGDPSIDERTLTEIQTVLIDSGARREVEELRDALVEEALTALERVRLTAPARQALTALAGVATRRVS